MLLKPRFLAKVPKACGHHRAKQGIWYLRWFCILVAVSRKRIHGLLQSLKNASLLSSIGREPSLSAWQDLESPWQHVAGCVSEGVSCSIQHGKPTLKMGNTTLRTVVLGWIQRRQPEGHLLSSLLPDFGTQWPPTAASCCHTSTSLTVLEL